MKKHLAPAQWFCLGAAVLLLAAAVAGYLTDTVTTYSTATLIERHKTGVGALNAQTPVSQTFVAAQGGLTAVDAMVSNYNKKLKTGTLTLWLTDGAGREIARQDYPVADLRNNAFVTLNLARPAADSAGQTYTLYASSDCTEQKGVTLRMGPLPEGSSGLTLTLPDGTRDGEDNALYLSLTYGDTARGWKAGLTLLLLSLCFAGCLPLAGRKERAHA